MSPQPAKPPNSLPSKPSDTNSQQNISNKPKPVQPEAFSFDYQRKVSRGEPKIKNLNTYNVNTTPISDSLDGIEDRINYEINKLLDTPIKKKGELTPSGDDINEGYKDFIENISRKATKGL